MRKKRTFVAVFDELLALTREHLDLLLSKNAQLKSDLPQKERIALTVDIIEIWKELRPMHGIIRESNPQGLEFFKQLDAELARYEAGDNNDKK